MAGFMATVPRNPEPSVAVATEPAESAGPASGAFSTLRNGNFRLLIGGSLSSGFAMWMEAIGQG